MSPIGWAAAARLDLYQPAADGHDFLTTNREIGAVVALFGGHGGGVGQRHKIEHDAVQLEVLGRVDPSDAHGL
jgi:hypothetical protein